MMAASSPPDDGGASLWQSAIEEEIAPRKKRARPDPPVTVVPVLCTVKRRGRLMDDPDDRDETENPYVKEEPADVVPTPSPPKIIFHEETHRYALCDPEGRIYPNLIISGSKVKDYIDSFSEKIEEGESLESALKSFQTGGGSSFSFGRTAGTPGATFRSVIVQYFQHWTSGELPSPRPYTYIERSKLFKSFAPKNEYGYFIPSRVFERVERWFINPSGHPYDLTVLEEYEEYQELYSLMEIGSPGHPLSGCGLFQSLFSKPVLTFPIDQWYLKQKYALPAMLGTALHAHLEARFKGMPPGECTDMYPLEEPQDLENVEAAVAHFGAGFFAHLEYRVGSFRHKICGSIDAIHVHPETGVWTIYDWKRANTLFEYGKETISSLFGAPSRDRRVSQKLMKDHYNPNQYVPVYDQISRTSSLYTYMMQMAVYRKLCILNGHPTSTCAYLVVIIPNHPGIRIIELDMKRQCRNVASPIEAVEWIFHEREKHLIRYLQ